MWADLVKFKCLSERLLAVQFADSAFVCGHCCLIVASGSIEAEFSRAFLIRLDLGRILSHQVLDILSGNDCLLVVACLGLLWCMVWFCLWSVYVM